MNQSFSLLVTCCHISVVCDSSVILWNIGCIFNFFNFAHSTKSILSFYNLFNPSVEVLIQKMLSAQLLFRLKKEASKNNMSLRTTKLTKWPDCPAKIQIRLGIFPVWSESSLSVWRTFGSLATQNAHSKDAYQTGQMGGCTSHFVGFVMQQLNYCKDPGFKLGKEITIADQRSEVMFVAWNSVLGSFQFCGSYLGNRMVSHS